MGPFICFRPDLRVLTNQQLLQKKEAIIIHKFYA